MWFATNRKGQQPASVSFADWLVMAFADYYRIRDIFDFDKVFRKNGIRLPDAQRTQEAA